MEPSYHSYFGMVLHQVAAEMDERGGFNTRHARDQAAVRMGMGRLKLEALCRDARSRFGTPWLPLDGFEAARYLAMQKYGWPIEYARGLGLDDLMFALAEEIHAFQLPAEAREAASGWARNHGLWEEFKPHLDNPEP